MEGGTCFLLPYFHSYKVNLSSSLRPSHSGAHTIFALSLRSSLSSHMEGKGGCCVTRYSNGAYDMSKVERIMLKFRPIAPKPLAGGTVSEGSSSESVAAFSRSAGRGGKRKRGKVTNRCNRRRRETAPSPSVLHAPAVTLPMLPETPDPKELDPPAVKKDSLPAWLNFEKLGSPAVDLQPAGSVVTVEYVMDTWKEERLGCTDGEKMRLKLREDTCPGFISDGYGIVTWTNGAFRDTVGEGRVWLVTKVGVPYGGFTCRVRVQRERSTDLTVPCDVWKIMDGGGFAWRLDVNAALTLSLAL